MLPERYRLEADLLFHDSPFEFGMALQIDNDFVKGYYLQFEPGRQRAQWKSPMRMYEDGGATFPYEVELERPLALAAGKPIHLTLLADGNMAVVYLDNQTALTARGFDLQARRLGLYVHGGHVSFQNVKLYTE